MFLNGQRTLVFDANYGVFIYIPVAMQAINLFSSRSFFTKKIVHTITMRGDTVTEAVDSDQTPNTGIEESKEEEWKPTLQFWLALAPLTVLAMMVSLDGTSVSVALPVWLFALFAYSTLLITVLETIDHCKGSSWLCY